MASTSSINTEVLSSSSSRTPSAPPAPSTSASSTRRRARSHCVSGESPIAVPITKKEQNLAALVHELNRQHELPDRNFPAHAPFVFRRDAKVEITGSVAASHPLPDLPVTVVSSVSIKPVVTYDCIIDPVTNPLKSKYTGNPNKVVDFRRNDRACSTPVHHSNAINMNFNGYGDAPQGVSRQGQLQSQGMTNGVNGNGAPGIGMGNMITPAGHQQDLVYIHSLLEEYSRMSSENARVTRGIVESTGRVRQMAIDKDLSNDELVEAVYADMNEATKNLEAETSDLRAKLEQASHSEKEYRDICYAYAREMGRMLEQFHTFKLKQVTDMCLWHKSYRRQLEFERKKNLELTCLIQDMRASAARGQAALQNFIREWKYTPAHYEMLAENTKLKQLVRTWKRMALPEFPDDDSEFSDDDDLIDPEEKKRIAKEEMARLRAKKVKQAEDVAGLNHAMGDAALE